MTGLPPLASRRKTVSARHEIQNEALLIAGRIPDLELQHEAVHLRFRRCVGALLFDRILRSQNQEQLRQGKVWSPIVTWRSCMDSSSADCTFAGARLISSASTRLANTGPRRMEKDPVCGLKICVPTTSAGNMSGVGWIRLNRVCSAVARVLTESVLANPGRLPAGHGRWPATR